MKRSLICLAMSLSAVATWAADPERIDKPAAQVGSSWRIRVADGFTKVPISETTYRVTAATDGEVQTQNEANEVAIVLDAASHALKRNGAVVFEPPLQRVRYPMSAGDRWESAYVYNSPTCGSTQSTLNFKAVAWEDVALPAGKFRALRVESEGVLRNSCGTNRHAHKHWYVPGKLAPVRQESTFYGGGRITRMELHELMSFTPP